MTTTPSTMTEADPETFQQVFSLLDGTSKGVLSLDIVQAFVAVADTPPAAEAVLRLFQEHDEDGSGDIDSGEFVALCSSLEALGNTPLPEMLARFEREQYRRLFGLVDDDGGGTISSGELKTFVEALQGTTGALTARYSASDVALMLRSYDNTELDFDDFFHLMRKIVGRNSVLGVIAAFESSMKRQREAKSSALQRFQNLARAVGRGDVTPNTPRRPSVAPTCTACDAKAKEIEALKARIVALEVQAAEAAIAKAAGSEREVREAGHDVKAAAPLFADYPDALSAAVFAQGGERTKCTALRWLECTDCDAIASDIRVVCETTLEAQAGLVPLLEQMRSVAAAAVAAKLEFFTAVDRSALGDKDVNIRPFAADCATRVAAKRAEALEVFAALSWTVKDILDARAGLCSLGLAAAHFALSTRSVLRAVLDAEHATQRLADLQVLLSLAASPRRSEAEDLMRTVANGQPTPDLEVVRDAAHGDQAHLTQRSVKKLCDSLDATLAALVAAATSVAMAQRRDRGVNTAPFESIVTVVVDPPPNNVPAEVERAASNATNGAEVAPKPLSRPPRVRRHTADKDHRAPAVDQLIERYVARGVPVPENFTRIGPPPKAVRSGNPDAVEQRVRHTFAFGPRRIDVVVVDGNLLAVVVGGGYMYFDEFCARYASKEALRSEAGAPTDSRSASPLTQGQQGQATHHQGHQTTFAVPEGIRRVAGRSVSQQPLHMGRSVSTASQATHASPEPLAKGRLATPFNNRLRIVRNPAHHDPLAETRTSGGLGDLGATLRPRS